MLNQIKEAANYIQKYLTETPKVAIVLGTGLQNLSADVENCTEIPYGDIPNFPVSTVEGHKGALLIGTIENTPVLVMQGRFHYYEGYTMQEVVFPIRVFKQLGINNLILSNASGGVNPDFAVGDVMLINDHINLFPDNPLRGANIDELGPRFPDMSEAYSKEMLDTAVQFAREYNIPHQVGVYAGLSGPTLETPSEYYYIRSIGADAVGMSTVPEVIAAVHCGMHSFAVSVITDLGVKGKIVKVTHEDVQRVANESVPKVTPIVKAVISSLNK